ncbi:MAG: threonine synthase [Bacteroidetes bacterium]|nr:threonine synthase [Bacteroidota bacterium]
MKYFSTNNKFHITGFEEAVINGLAPDGGLYMPARIPVLEKSFIENITSYSLIDIAQLIIENFTESEIPQKDLKEIIEKAFIFPAPLHSLDKNTYVLELFHGPTLAFKDFGARFMARTMEYFVRKRNMELNILVATSGDTGSAVANGFYDVEGINVFILYPSNKVSFIQEKQLTTLDKNVVALEIDGTFDDCQRLVKEAFVNKSINEKLNLSSANSINIARLLPQSIYYFEAYKQLIDKNCKTIFSVPSGNLGNLTAGLFAFKMGLPVHKFIGATNSNKVFTDYLNTGNFLPTASRKTFSNAMDVGNPSNIERILNLYSNELFDIRKDIYSLSFNDFNTLEGMKEVYDKFNYIIDPHGAIGYQAAKNKLNSAESELFNTIILETAHPSKFNDIVEKALGFEVEIPDRLKECLNKEKHSTQLSNKFEDLKNYLLSRQ